MSSAQVAAKTIRKLELEDWQVLEAIEKSVPYFESVPLQRIERTTTLHPDQIKFRLDRLNLFGFINSGPHGFILNTSGLDVLALNHFVKKNLISGMGKSIGMGKESDVFETISESGTKSVIKFYRIGRISFRATRKTRSYTGPESQHQWLTINIHAARKEAEGLKRALVAGVTTPNFIAVDRHAVLMQEVEGIMLYKATEKEIENPTSLLRNILTEVRKTYVDARMINGDLSEYNILFDGEKAWIIDWPQFLESTHPNSIQLLRRDVENTCSYFRRKFGLQVDKNEALFFVIGKEKSVKITQG